MTTRFHVASTCVKIIDVDPVYRDVANKTDIELGLHGYLVSGDVRPGMFVNVRPHLRLGKCYRIASVERFEPDPALARAMELFMGENGLEQGPEIRKHFEEM